MKALAGFRAAVAIGMIACGVVVVVRVLGYGLRIETLPGIVLGAAMVALGVHRLSLIARSRRCITQ
ncbi:MAG: hypothetical protein JO092_11820 [Candidatus Eremiobacteraeota bacterium]|nr:hypothetical protein [Candidatus Eremiobacteraeota bacterium]